MHEPAAKRLRLLTRAQVEKVKLHDASSEKLKVRPPHVTDDYLKAMVTEIPVLGEEASHFPVGSGVVAGVLAGLVIHRAECDGIVACSRRPPVRGGPVSGRLRRGEVCIGRNAKYGDPKWGNWHRVIRHFTVERCVQLHRQELVDR